MPASLIEKTRMSASLIEKEKDARLNIASNFYIFNIILFVACNLRTNSHYPELSCSSNPCFDYEKENLKDAAGWQGMEETTGIERRVGKDRKRRRGYGLIFF